MKEEKLFKSRAIKLIVAVIICVFVAWLMSVLQCEMATPAY
jgi:Kef-type K+ transport system membrane component KefB